MAAVGLADRGHRVTLYADQNVPFVDDFRGHKKPRLSISRRMRGGVGRHQVYLGIPPYGAQLACQTAVRNGKRVIAYLFDVPPLVIDSGRTDRPAATLEFYNQYLHWVRKAKAHVVVLANCNKDAAVSWLGISASKVHVVYPGVNLKRVPGDLTRKPRQNRVVWISRILPYKLFPHFLGAVAPFGVGVDVVCGRAQHDHVRRYGLEGYVKWHVRVSDEKKFRIIADAKLLVMSSRFEGFGMPLVEAWACGTPVAAYRLATLAEVAKPMQDVTYWAEPFNRESLQEAIFRGLCDDKAGGFKPDKRFSIGRLGKELEGVLKKAVH